MAPPGPTVALTPVGPDGPAPATVTVAPAAASPAPAPTAKPANAPATAPAAVPPVIPAGSARAATALQVALSELGRPYRYGSLGPRAFDCSGLVLFAYRAAGLELPHSAAAQFRSGVHVARTDLQPGDLIFWKGLGHVGIYVGGGDMVHAPQTGGVVSITSIDQGSFAGAVRP